MAERGSLASARRLVVKVGSSSLVTPSGRVSRPRIARAVAQVAGATRDGRACVLVSSGAIAAGLEVLGSTRRPRDMAGLQAAAAVGQGRLISVYQAEFRRHRLVAAQVLLTQDDFVRRGHFVNARATVERLLAAGVVPVVNENDTVGTDEIRFGDNDRLAALVAVMVGADLLLLLSDVDAIYERDPRRHRSRRLPLVEEVERLGVRGLGATGSGFGSGGMASKLQAAGIATRAGVSVVVAGASRRDVVARVLGGADIGTFLPARATPKRARKAWLAFASGVRGRLIVDAGAERALRRDGRSLLPAGVVRVEGGFVPGDVVEIVAEASAAPFARGIARCGADELAAHAERRRGLAPGERAIYDREAVHRDELVILEDT